LLIATLSLFFAVAQAAPKPAPAAADPLGLTAIAQLIKSHSTALEIVGGTMLLVFGVRTFIAHPQLRLDDKLKAKEQDASTLVRAMASTFALAITNPATLLAFTAMFAGVAGLVGGQASYFGTGLLIIGVLAGATTWWFTLTTVAGLFHAKINERIMTLINRISGVVITTFGAVVFGHLIWQMFS